MENIVIYGAGAIGSVVGALLSGQNNVTLIGRKEHVDAINKNGLKVTGAIDKVFKLKAHTEIAEIKPDTLIILTVKAHDTEEAILTIKDKIREDTIILSLQNGLGIRELINRTVDNKCKVLCGITIMGVKFVSPGEVNYNSKGKAVIEANDKVKGVFEKGELDFVMSSDIEKEIWKKAIANCVLNPLTSVLKIKTGELLKHKEKVNKIIEECLLVAAAEGITFEEDVYEFVFGVINKTRENTTSMLQDVLKGKKTEIDFLNGAVVKLAEKHGVEVPVNKDLVEKIKLIQPK